MNTIQGSYDKDRSAYKRDNSIITHNIPVRINYTQAQKAKVPQYP